MEEYIFSGRLTADSKLGPTASNGSTPINFSVAVDQSYKNRQTGEMVNTAKFIDCTYWVNTDNKRTALPDMLRKGVPVAVKGSPEARAYLDKENKPVARLTVTVRNIDIFCAPKRQIEEGAKATNQPAEPTPTVVSDSADLSDLPF